MSPATEREPEGREASPAPAEGVDEPTVDATAQTSPQTSPPRPELGGERFVATKAPPPSPPTVSTGLSLWVGSLAVGLLAAGSIVRSQPALRDQFAQEVVAADPSTTLGTAQDAASVLVWVVVGGLALVWLVHLVLVVRTAGAHGGARWALIVLGVLGAGAVLLLQDVIADPDVMPVRDLNRIALVAQASLALLGSLFLATRSAGRWFKDVRRRR
ncbi:hypothetical protein [Cellulomonas soli]|uniref:Uncharacterized protein n=1 Tax=Cellulomonas soli TaxID=931535 RepID=A0A512P8I5_9CELL|nr:hypothetical protein [Cellulomonas soli]NYI57734.1 hypothetical protein [Cellulomonas soli]GEP67515.1 hypothetical protein CSO01_02300 [Cellulomonas soli]